MTIVTSEKELREVVKQIIEPVNVIPINGFPLVVLENKTEQEGEYLFHCLLYREFLNLCKQNKVNTNWQIN